MGLSAANRPVASLVLGAGTKDDPIGDNRGVDGGAPIVFDTATFKEVNRMLMQSRASTPCTTRSRPEETSHRAWSRKRAAPSCELAQSLKLGTFLAMLAVMASVRSWLMSMAAFQVAM